MTVDNENVREELLDLAIAKILDPLSPGYAARLENLERVDSAEQTLLIHELEETAALLSLDAVEVTPPSHLRSELLNRISWEEPSEINAPTHRDVFANEEGWHRLLEGVHSKVLFTEPTNGYVTSLLRMDPGARLPDHFHKGNEQCLILAGEFRMYGKVYGPGDFTVALSGSLHRDVYTDSGATVLLVSPPELHPPISV